MVTPRPSSPVQAKVTCVTEPFFDVVEEVSADEFA